jgi:hypothetical protein
MKLLDEFIDTFAIEPVVIDALFTNNALPAKLNVPLE